MMTSRGLDPRNHDIPQIHGIDQMDRWMAQMANLTILETQATVARNHPFRGIYGDPLWDPSGSPLGTCGSSGRL